MALILAHIHIRQACEGSLRRLQTDYIDLYQLHCGATREQAAEVLATLEDLCAEGKIRSYGWSTGELAAVEHFAAGQPCTAIQHGLNVLDVNQALLDLCATHNLASINNAPLASGLLSGKYTAASVLPPDDFRSAGHSWALFFDKGRPRPEFLQKVAAAREILTGGGRTLTQGALAWIWAKAPHTIPIPGFKTVQQVEENCSALSFGPLTPQQMAEVERVLRVE